MDEIKTNIPQNTPDSLSLIPLGGVETVTKNMYVYEYKDEILIVDCGLGFADETMLGVDLLLPDITYLLNTKKRIVGMLLTHGHEDHIGAVPFVIPQLQEAGKNFPIFASPLTAAFTNEKLKEFRVDATVQTVKFESPEVRIGQFTARFIRITHSVPDTANIFIKTPVGNIFHASDFKFDLTPADGKKTDFQAIAKTAQEGVLALVCDSLGSERPGHTPSEYPLEERFENAMRQTKGKFIVTTYSSNIARLNQAIAAAERQKRKVCFVGRSLVKAKTIAQKLGYLHMQQGTEVSIEAVKKINDNQLLLIVAGSQGQENSALTRIATGEHKEISLSPEDVVVFSSDTIPGNEISVNVLIDALAKKGVKIYYSDITDEFHVSGHGSSEDLMLMMSLTKSKFIVPISGTYKHMAAYRGLAEKMGYARKNIGMLEGGLEIVFTRDSMRYGKKYPVKHVYVDEISGEEVESFVLRDRERLAKDGIVIVMAEVAVDNGQIINTPELVARGFSPNEAGTLQKDLQKTLQSIIQPGRVTNWVHIRRSFSDAVSKMIFKKLRRRPLVLPVIVEV
jgi:ribonuclease J